MTAKTAFLAAVEDVVAQCLFPVPAWPLEALSEAIAAELDSSDTESADELELLWNLFDAAENATVSWESFGQEQALVDSAVIQCLADALHAYRKHIRCES